MGIRRQLGWLGTALLALAAACSPPPAKTGSIAGKVTVQDGTMDAVFVAIPGDVRIPNADGSFSFDGQLEGTYQVTATKEGYVTATAQATVVQGKVAEVTLDLVKKAADNRPPQLVSFSVSPNQISRGGKGRVLVVASDPDGDTLRYAFHAGEGWTVTPITGEPNTAELKAPASDAASTEVSVEVTDGRGGKVIGTVLVGTLPNHAPLVTSVVASPGVLQPGATGTLAVQAADPDGDPLTFSWKAPAGWTVRGTGAQVEVVAPEAFDQTAVVSVDVADASGATVSGSVAVSTAHNQAPIFSSLTALPTPVAPGGTVTLSASASDPDGGAITYTWTAPPGWTLGGQGAQVTLTAPAQHGVQALVQVSAADPTGKSTQSQVLVRTSQNSAPILTALTATPPQVAPGKSTRLQALASDADGETLTYTWTAPPGWTLSGEGAQVTLTAPAQYGEVGRVQLVVEDGHGGQVTGEVAVSTRSNSGPLVQSITAVPGTTRPGGTLQLAVSASDPDGDTLTYAWTVPSGWTLAGGGAQVQLTAPDEYAKTATVRVAISDGETTAEASVVVGTQADRAPVVSSLVGAPNPVARAGVVEVSASASDPDGDTLTYSWTAPSGWTLAGSGAQVQLTAPAERGVSGILRLEVTSGSGLTATSQLLVSTFDNRPPRLTSLAATPAQIAPGGTIALEAQASDPDGDSLTYDWSVPAGWTLSGTGPRVTLTAPANRYGATGTVFLAVSDPLGVAASGRVQVATLENQAPEVIDVSATPNPARSGSRVQATVTATDPENQTLGYTWTVPSGWTLVSGGRTATLTASAQRGVSGTLAVEVDDGFGGTATGTVELSTAENSAPEVTLAGTLTDLAPGSQLTVQAEASDADDDALTYEWSAPQGWTVSGSGAQVTLTAHAGFSRSGQLHVVVRDGYGGSASADADLSTRANAAPQLAGISATPNPVQAGATTQLTAQASDADGQPLTYAWTVPPGWTLSGSGAQVAVTAPQERGASATVQLVVSDGAGGTAEGSVELTVPANRTPSVQLTTEATLPVGAGEVIPLHAQATDADGDTLTYTWTMPPGWTLSGTGADVLVTAPRSSSETGTVQVTVADAFGASAQATLELSTRGNSRPVIASLTASPNPAPAGAVLQVQASATDDDGQELTYEWSAPEGWALSGEGTNVTLTAPNERGLTATLGLTVSDGLDEASRTLTVATAPNQQPTVQLQSAPALQLAPQALLAVQAQAADGDDDQLTYTWSATNGFVVSGTGAQATVTAPDAYARLGEVRLQVADAFGGTALATLSVATRANSAPTISEIVAAPVPVAAGGEVVVHAEALDLDGNPLTYTWTAPEGWLLTGEGADVVLTAPHERGASALLHLEVSDGYGQSAESEVALSTVENQLPAIAITTQPSTDLAPRATFEVEAQGSDADNDQLTYVWTVPTGWSVTGTGTRVTVRAPDQYGVTGTVRVTATDGFGGNATASIDLGTRAGHAPTVDALVASPNPVTAGQTLQLSATADDQDGDALTYTWSVPSGWILSGSGAQVSVQAPGERGLQGDATVTVDDGYGNTASRTLVLRTQANQRPTALLDGAATELEPRAEVALTGAGTDPDGDELSFAWTAPTGWTIVGSGASVTLRAPNSYGSTGDVLLTVDDGHGGTSTAQLAVSTRGGQAPVIASLTADNETVSANGTIHLTVSASDADNDPLSYTWTATSGWIVVGSDATATVTATSLRGAQGIVTVAVSDGFGNVSSRTITLSTRENAQPTVALTGEVATDLAPGTQVAFDAAGADTDADELTYTWSVPQGWSVQATGGHAVVTAPNAYGSSGEVRVTVTDGFGGSALASLSVSTREGHAPIINALTADNDTVSANGTIHLTAAAVDIDNDELSYAWTASSGWSVSGTDETATVTAANSRGAQGTVTVTVSDGYGNAIARSITLRTRENAQPTVALTGDTATDLMPGTQVAFDAAGADTDADELTYSWTVPQGWTVQPSGSHAVVTAPNAYGSSGEVRVTVTDGFGGSALASLSVSTREGHAPTINTLTADNDTVAAGGTIHLTVEASDNDDDPLTYSWTVSNGWTISASGTTATVTAPNTRNAQAIVMVTVTDGFNTVSLARQLHTLDNRTPTVTLTATPALVTKGGTITLQATATDADGDTLSYQWVAPPEWTFSGSGSEVTAQAPDAFGRTAIAEVTVSDGHGGSTVGLVQIGTYPNRAPTFGSQPPTTSPRAGRDLYEYAAQASDPDGDDVTLTLVGAPPEMTLTDGLVEWPVPRSASGDVTFTLRASDGALTTDQQVTVSVAPLGFDASLVRQAPNAVAVAVGDVDADGQPDLVIATSTGELQVILNDGQNGLAQPVTIAVANAVFTSVQLADLNGDDAPEIVAADDSNQTVVLLENDGQGGFDPANLGRVTTTFSHLKSVVVADLAGDGALDLAVAGTSTAGDGVQVYSRDSEGEFVAAGSLLAATCASTLVVGDLDGDHGDDLVVARDCDDGHVEVFLRTQQGGFTGTTLDTGAAGAGARSLALGDLDGDGDRDLVVATSGDDTVRTFLNDGSAVFTAHASQSVDLAAAAGGLVLADIDDNGHFDVVVSNGTATASGSSAPGAFYVLYGDSEGGLSTPSAFGGATLTGGAFLGTADFDGDLLPDVASVNAAGQVAFFY